MTSLQVTSLFEYLDNLDNSIEAELTSEFSEYQLATHRLRQLVYQSKKMAEAFLFDFDEEVAKILAKEPIDVMAIHNLSAKKTALYTILREIKKAEKFLNDD